jgi:hypothetical protein
MSGQLVLVFRCLVFPTVLTRERGGCLGKVYTTYSELTCFHQTNLERAVRAVKRDEDEEV